MSLNGETEVKPFFSVSIGLAVAWMGSNLLCRCLHKITLYNIKFKTVWKPEEASYFITAVYPRFRISLQVESKLTGLFSISCRAGASLVTQRFKSSASNVGNLGSIPGSGRSPGEGNGNPLQYSCLGNPMDGEAWWPQFLASQRVGHNRVTSLSFFLS